MKSRAYHRLLLVVMFAALTTACGQKDDLYHPDDERAEKHESRKK